VQQSNLALDNACIAIDTYVAALVCDLVAWVWSSEKPIQSNVDLVYIDYACTNLDPNSLPLAKLGQRFAKIIDACLVEY
jgi:hypothetical protein